MRRSIRYGTLGVVLLAGAAGVWSWRHGHPPATPSDPSPPVSAITASPADAAAVKSAGTSAPAAPQPIAAIAPDTAPSPAPPTPSTTTATFDVVRIGPQGNAVIAGRAVPNAEVVALDGNTVIGRATADAQGEWVILPAATLAPGPHSLRLEAPSSGGQASTAASDVISVTVPAPSRPAVAGLPAVATAPTIPSAMQAVPAPAPIAGEAAQPVSVTSPVVADKPGKGNLIAGDNVAAKRALDQAARDKSLTVRPGNSLWRIARHSYGAGERFPIIYSANRDRIGDPDLIYPGQVFKLPSTN